ncbi:MAG: hypothetical protein KAG96_08070 [Ichthyobacteriaceae bacterium]|nr:hypothetical protein [Ichthyobacteriaceae bacterium]
MKPNYLFILITLVMPTLLISQVTNFSGKYEGGKANYMYYIGENYEPVFHGEFIFFPPSSSGKNKIVGNFNHGKRSGEWTVTKKVAVRGYSTVTTAVANYKEGKLNGFVSYIKRKLKGDKKVEEYKAEFVNNIQVGNVYYRNYDKNKNSTLNLTLNSDGFINGTLDFTYKNSGNTESLVQEYNNGFLEFSLHRNITTGDIIKKINNRKNLTNLLSCYDSITDTYVVPKKEWVSKTVYVIDTLNTETLSIFEEPVFNNFPLKYIRKNFSVKVTSSYSIDSKIDNILEFWDVDGNKNPMHLHGMGYDLMNVEPVKDQAVDVAQYKLFEKKELLSQLYQSIKFFVGGMTHRNYSDLNYEVDLSEYGNLSYAVCDKVFEYTVNDTLKTCTVYNLINIINKYANNYTTKKDITVDEMELINQFITASIIDKENILFENYKINKFRVPNFLEIKLIDNYNTNNTYVVTGTNKRYSDNVISVVKKTDATRAGDIIFNTGDYKSALSVYMLIVDNYDSNSYLEEQISKCSGVLYSEVIKIADSLYKSNQFVDAIEVYEDGVLYSEGNDYATNQINLCIDKKYVEIVLEADSMYFLNEYKLAISIYKRGIEYSKGKEYIVEKIALSEARILFEANDPLVKRSKIAQKYRRVRKAYSKIYDYYIESKEGIISVERLQNLVTIQINLLKYDKTQMKVLNKELRRIDSFDELVVALR